MVLIIIITKIVMKSVLIIITLIMNIHIIALLIHLAQKNTQNYYWMKGMY